jgi:DNA mismatch repair protein MutS
MGFREYLLDQLPPEMIQKWKLDTLFSSADPVPVEKEAPSNTPIHTNFRLPISYLEPSKLHNLSPIVSQDLELYVPGSDQSIYTHLFQPISPFGRNMIPEWTKSYTTNTDFLEDTQYLLSKVHSLPGYGPTSLPQYNDNSGNYVPNYDKFREMWHDIQEDKFFLEKYGYMEWSMLLYLNENASFLQCLSFVNVISPLISLLLPLIFIILPFIILKLQRIPINFSVYLEVLKSVAKNHFIGKALMSFTSFTWDKAAYLALTGGLYFLQIYQNVSICYRFYRNMILVNQHLVEMREFVHHSLRQMEPMVDIVRGLPTYGGFHNDLLEHYTTLKALNAELSYIRPFNHSVAKFGESGYMLRCYYRLHTIPEYESAIRYAAGFEGYMENLRGICCNIAGGKVSMAQFTLDPSGCTMVDQCYPPLLDEPYISRNTVDFDKNIILSGPNRSGKTTVLKTTALNIIFTQQVGCGFYSSARICPYTHIHSYLNIPDTSGRDSLFQAESRRCKTILDEIKSAKVGSRHFCIFDELYSGTNPEEATKAGYAFLKYLSGFENVDFMLTTHYIKICKKLLKSDGIENHKMYVKCLADGGYDYTYRMVKGISKIKGAAQVMKDMDYPQEIIDGMK